jgi:hypothetical protein
LLIGAKRRLNAAFFMPVNYSKKVPLLFAPLGAC